MREIITKVEREKGYTYSVDKDGNVVKSNYNWFKDPYTLVAIAIVLLSSLYYMQIKDMKTIESNFEDSCFKYMEARENWIASHPGEIPTLKEVFSSMNGAGVNLPSVDE